MLNRFDFIPYTADPDSTYSQLRNMCSKKSVLKSCKKFIDLLEGVDLPIENVCNTVRYMLVQLEITTNNYYVLRSYQANLK
jgi:hypothetical protein